MILNQLTVCNENVVNNVIDMKNMNKQFNHHQSHHTDK